MIGPNFGVVAVPLTIYSTTAFGTRAQGRIVLGLGFVGARAARRMAVSRVAAGHDRTRLHGPWMAGEYLLLATIVALCAAIVFIAWLLGGVIYRRRRRDRRRQGTQPPPRTRTRIRDPAGRRRRAHAHRPGDARCHRPLAVRRHRPGRWRPVCGQRPIRAAAVGVLETISQTGREALAQTRSLLGVLRSDEDDSWSKSPLPGVGDIESLIADVRSAGLPVSVSGIADFDEERAARRRRAGGVPDRAGGADECAQARRQRGASACEPAARGTVSSWSASAMTGQVRRPRRTRAATSVPAATGSSA
jgi:hypothetical protein